MSTTVHKKLHTISSDLNQRLNAVDKMLPITAIYF